MAIGKSKSKSKVEVKFTEEVGSGVGDSTVDDDTVEKKPEIVHPNVDLSRLCEDFDEKPKKKQQCKWHKVGWWWCTNCYNFPFSPKFQQLSTQTSIPASQRVAMEKKSRALTQSQENQKLPTLMMSLACSSTIQICSSRETTKWWTRYSHHVFSSVIPTWVRTGWRNTKAVWDANTSIHPKRLQAANVLKWNQSLLASQKLQLKLQWKPTTAQKFKRHCWHENLPRGTVTRRQKIKAIVHSQRSRRKSVSLKWASAIKLPVRQRSIAMQCWKNQRKLRKSAAKKCNNSHQLKKNVHPLAPAAENQSISSQFANRPQNLFPKSPKNHELPQSAPSRKVHVAKDPVKVE